MAGGYLWLTRSWFDDLARQLDGEYVHSFWSTRRRVLVPRHRTVVSVSVQGVIASTTSVQVGRFEAPFLVPAGPRLRLLSQGTLRMWMRQFGYQDIEIGDSAFDLRYIVKGSPEDEVITVLRAASGRLANLDYVVNVESNGSHVAIVGGVLPDLDWNHYIDATAALATADLFGIGALESLPEAELRWPEEPGPPVATVRVPTPVELSCTVDADGRARTYARARSTTDHVPDAPSGLRGTLRVDDARIELVWPGICEDPDELMASAATLAQLAAGRGTTPYR